jgi:transposase InsO family protein
VIRDLGEHPSDFVQHLRRRRPKTSPSAISASAAGLIAGLRKELAGHGLDVGPHTIAWHLEHHHQVTVSPATVSRYLARAGLVTPDPAKRPRSSCLRFAAELPGECWQSDFTRCRLADGTDTEILTWLDDHSRYALPVTAHRRSPAGRAGRLPRRRDLLPGPGINPDR